MPLISKIEQQKRKKDRYNIFLNDIYSFSVSEQTLLENSLKVGQNLTEEEISQISKKEELSRLMDLSLRFVGVRPRSEKEVKDYLAKKISTLNDIKFKEALRSPQIEITIKKLKKYKYLNDSEFSKWLIQSRRRSSPKGTRIIKMELKQKGIKPEIIQKVLKKAINEKTLAKIALSKKLIKWSNLKEFELKKKVYTFLLSRGFDYETIEELFATLPKKR